MYERRGFGHRQSHTGAAALLVVDLNYGFTDPTSPLCCPAEEALAANERLLRAARAGGAPVFFTTVEYDAESIEVARAFLEKVPALGMLTKGSRWVEIDERIAPLPGERVIRKLFASAFWGTRLAELLEEAGSRTVVVTGASTSGCVRATVVDALQHGYRVLVPREAVADRAADAHAASLLDMDAKYADVVALEEAAGLLEATSASGASR